MTGKVYKTAQGKIVDLGALILQNENVRAVGNMGVNARGDLLDSNNRVIDSKNQQIRRQTDRQVQPATERQVHNSTAEVRRARAAQQAQTQAPVQPTPETPAPVATTNTDNQPLTGLAAALARTQEGNNQ